ncbi:MAG: hypothetical protein PHR28_06740 [candidate division Zixibacteria bacterium]|nr:hypothetical protein [candidate division Zixibacteria bacterium]
MRLLIYLATLTIAAVIAAEPPAPVSEIDRPSMAPYLGLAVPVPDTIPALTAPPSGTPYISGGSYALSLVVDKKGHVKKLRYPSDSADYYAPVKEIYKQFHFRFLDGAKIGFPLSVPVTLEYSHAVAKARKVSLRFPIAADSISDILLLTRFFAENKIIPPTVAFLPPVYYRMPSDWKAADCPTITARVFLDAEGKLENLDFPFPGGEGMTHPVQAALIHAALTPARKNGKPFPCGFYVTFRIFDNLKYPFTPFRPADSTRTTPITGKYFMTTYFNDRDIAIFPLPRRFASGVISAGTSPQGIIGTVRAGITIGPDGVPGRIDVDGGQRPLTDAARKAVRLTEWYPARNNRGEAVWFSGRMTITLDGSARIVYIPEWVDR